MKPLEPWDLPLDGTHLIEASAGTGKTYTIGTLVLRLIFETGLTIDRILVVTFTRAATAELRDRIRRRLVGALADLDPRAGPIPPATGDGLRDYLAARRAAGHATADAAALAAALRDFDTAPIFTIHGFCQRVLQEFAFESGTSFEAALTDDAPALQREIVADYWASQTYAAPPVLVAHLIDTADVTPATLERLASALAGARGLEVLPAPNAGDIDPPIRDAASLDGAVAAWHAARAAARSAFAGGRDDVDKMLATSPGLTHRSLTKASVPRWLDQLGSWLVSDAPPPATPVKATLARFTADGIAPHVKEGFTAPSHPLLDALDRVAAVDAALVAGLDAWCDGIRLGLAPYLEHETRLRRRRANAQSFDDLLHDLAAALEGDRGPRLAAHARARYAAALIDEFQDTDDVQYRIFRALFGPSAAAPSTDTASTASTSTPSPVPPDEPATAVRATFLALIGDPKQAIYAFRGADIFAYLRAADDAGPDRRWTLSRNRRSDEGLVRALNAVWSEARVPQPFVHPGIEYHAVASHHPDRLAAADGSGALTPPLTILRLTPDDPGAETDGNGLLQSGWAQRVIPRRVAADIAQLLASPPVILGVEGGRGGRDQRDQKDLRDQRDGGRAIEPGDVAVLTRTNVQAAAVQRALGRLGIPSVRHGDASVFETDEAAELARVLAAVVEPGAARLVRGALATRLLGADAARLAILAADEAAWEAEVACFRSWLERWQQAGFIQAFRRIVDDAGIAGRLLALPDGERRLTNVQHVAELIHRAAHAGGHSGVQGPRALLGWLARMRTDTVARTAEVGDSAQLRLEHDTKAVQVTTVHRSKGLEYPVVYCPYLWYRSQRRKQIAVRFTDPADRRPKLDIQAQPAQAHIDAAEVDDFAEDVRLAYVAVTRAKHDCRIVWGPIAGAERSALGRLCHPVATSDAGDAAAPSAPTDPPLPPRRRLGDAIDHAARRMAQPADFDADLDALAAACAGALAVRPLADGAAPAWRSPPPPDDPLASRHFTGQIQRGHRRTSYSALVGPSLGVPADADATRDHDAEADGTDAMVGIGDSGATSSDGVAGSDAGARASLPTTVTLDGFPAGADPGTCLHEVFERIDFTNPVPWPEVAVNACRRAGIDVALANGLPTALADIVGTRLGDGSTGFSLSDVPRSVRLNEMPFVLPVALGPGDEARRAFSPSDLAAALAGDGAAGMGRVPSDYPDAVGRLGFEAVQGHLSGFVDMVCRVRGRWYIVDWKSNRLGSTWDDYTVDRITGAMAHHHYYLQYHLYTVALHRYLQQRVPGYHYAEAFGGVFYLFVRGMHPAHGPTRGVFFDRPAEGCVARLEALLDGRWGGGLLENGPGWQGPVAPKGQEGPKGPKGPK